MGIFVNCCPGGWLPWKWTIRLLLSSVNARAAAKGSTDIGTTYAMNDKTTLVQWKVAYMWVRKTICPRLHRSSVTVSCITQMILVLRNERRNFTGLGLEEKGTSFFGSCTVLEIECWTLQYQAENDRFVLFLHSHVFLCFFDVVYMYSLGTHITSSMARSY